MTITGGGRVEIEQFNHLDVNNGIVSVTGLGSFLKAHFMEIGGLGGTMPSMSPTWDKPLVFFGTVGNGVSNASLNISTGGRVDFLTQLQVREYGTVNVDNGVLSVGTAVSGGELFMDGFSGGANVNVTDGTVIAGLIFGTNNSQIYLDDGTLQVDRIVLNDGAVLKGTGNIIPGWGPEVTIVNDGGFVSPGLSPGALEIDGDYEQTSLGQLSIEIGGVSAGVEYDLITLTGDATLGGILDVTLIDGFVPAATDRFTFLVADSIIGEFDQITFAFGSGEVEYGSNFLTISNVTVPEPSTFYLLGLLCVAAILQRARVVRRSRYLGAGRIRVTDEKQVVILSPFGHVVITREVEQLNRYPA